MKPDTRWPFTIKMEEAARDRESVTMRVTAEFQPEVEFRPFGSEDISCLPLVRVAECKHPEVAQAVAMLNDMSDKARKQALAHIGVIFKFDKGTF